MLWPLWPFHCIAFSSWNISPTRREFYVPASTAIATRNGLICLPKAVTGHGPIRIYRPAGSIAAKTVSHTSVLSSNFTRARSLQVACNAIANHLAVIKTKATTTTKTVNKIRTENKYFFRPSLIQWRFKLTITENNQGPHFRSFKRKWPIENK